MNESVLPAPGRVLIAPSQVDQQEQETESGLLIMFGAQTVSCQLDRGVILACGSRVDEWWSELQPATTVLYASHAGNPVGENHLIGCDQIAAVIKDEA